MECRGESEEWRMLKKIERSVKRKEQESDRK